MSENFYLEMLHKQNTGLLMQHIQCIHELEQQLRDVSKNERIKMLEKYGRGVTRWNINADNNEVTLSEDPTGFYVTMADVAALQVGNEEALQQASREADESAKDAFRRGWKQAKIAISNRVADLAFKKDGEWLVFELSLKRDIAAMEYKGESK